MTIPISTNRVQYDGNGAQVNFPYTFRILREEDLVVVYTNPAGVDATWILNTHYSVTDVDEPSHNSY